MGIQIVWDNDEQTIIRHIYEKHWSLEDYYALIDENFRQIASVNHRVDIINDLRELTVIPPNVVPAIRYAARKAHPNEGINVIVASPTHVKVLIEAINQAVGEVTEVLHVRTIDEAYPLIAQDMAEHGLA
ncbi:MAG: hypothetical protein ABI700_20700 [Chloroflexota bacterium]